MYFQDSYLIFKDDIYTASKCFLSISIYCLLTDIINPRWKYPFF